MVLFIKIVALEKNTEVLDVLFNIFNKKIELARERALVSNRKNTFNCLRVDFQLSTS